MEQIRSQDQQQKDFLSFLFQVPEPPADQHRAQDTRQNDMLNGPQLSGQRMPSALPNFTGSNSTSFNQQPLDLMAMMSMQGMDSSHPTVPSAATLTPQMLLEQQYKLTQLHQLQQLQNQIQNQIFQQQAISSTEIRPLPNPDFLTRMNPSYQNSQQDMYHPHGLDTVPLPSPQDPPGSNQYMRHPGSASAPANIAFHTSPSFGLPSPSDLDIDISPLTSPWLEAYQQQPSHTRPSNKRAASPSGDDSARVSRKRTTPTMATSTKAPRNVKSATSTPLLRSSRGRRNSTLTETDSPSPVDLSMPPPAPPGTKPSHPSSMPTNTAGVPTHEETRITPVTPASIMNLGRLGISSGLAPIPQAPRPEKSKEPAKPKETTSAAKGSRKSGLPLISPGPKPILPAGSPASLNIGSSAISQQTPLTRKSHKDAEQKRRDSLKSAYDDLRILLPPIPLPSDDNFPDEPILPGALPPRGPPKAGGDGPNKGVSKLQLLRCGNDFLRTLKGRVERRDTEIAILRREVLRLRDFVGEETLQGGEDIDLEVDLDAVEATNPRLGHSVGDDDGDDGEE
ncbi:hypothetical protein BU15DRAFT_46179 [Melanogaster broomeanus]|nr:hypothetical protein BU15DRAFT_46179 [Melanogaster broomeanus]